MGSLQLTTTLLGLGLAFTILVLVRRDHLCLSYGLFWVVIACAAAVMGVWPSMIDRIAHAVGIGYSPSLLLLIASITLFLKSLSTDIVNTRLERQIRRLNQRIALIEVGRTPSDGER